MTVRMLLIVVLLTVAPAVHVAGGYGDFRGVQVHHCYDGDTCTVTIPGVHPVIGDRIAIRLRGLDSPEMRGRCEAESRQARAARDYLQALLKRASRIDLLAVERGKYFRLVATLMADGVDVAQALILRGLARPYSGGRRLSWCR